MRVKIMLPLLWLLGYSAVDTIVGSERGSRSSSSAAAETAETAPMSVIRHGQRQQQRRASVRERDFRPSSPWPDPTSVYKSLDIGDEHLIGGRVNFFTPDGFIRKRRSVARPKKWPREAAKPKDGTKKAWNSKSGGQVSSKRKRSEDDWINGDVEQDEDLLKMHAFIVRDEDVPDCGDVADKVTKTRYFMCSGAILNEKHVLTAATCMNRAQIYEHHIEAELAVLVGALQEKSYVIKIAHYEIHPEYIPDPNSIHHATNNVAILTLSCSVSHKIVSIPKLPSNIFDNVAHVCCPERCKLLTVIENLKNQQTIKVLPIKHLPSPRHVDDHDDDSKDLDDDDYMMRSIKGGGKNRKSSKRLRGKKRPTLKRFDRQIRDSSKIDHLKTKELDSDKNKSDSNSDIEMDWDAIKKEIAVNDVKKENKEKLRNFLKNSMSDIITKILESMTRKVAHIEDTFPYFNDILQSNITSIDNKMNQIISEFIAKKILKLALKELSILSKHHKDIDEISFLNKKDIQRASDKGKNNSENKDDEENTKEKNDSKKENENTEDEDTEVNEENAEEKGDSKKEKDNSEDEDTKVNEKNTKEKDDTKKEKDNSEDEDTEVKEEKDDSKKKDDSEDKSTEIKEENAKESDESKKDSSKEKDTKVKEGTTKNKNDTKLKGTTIRPEENVEPEDIMEPEENVEPEVILEKNVYCPPLGSPIISNNMLVGLIAYTCDDAQNWVEWKYTSVIDSIKWIRTEMTKVYIE